MIIMTNCKLTWKQPGLCLIASVLVLLLVYSGPARGNSNQKIVTVELNYGADKMPKKAEVPWREGLTALEALMHAAAVSTHPVGRYVFVASIDGIAGERGVMAWYYKVNGESTGKLAVWQPVYPSDTVTWLYLKDVCSPTVDGNKP